MKYIILICLGVFLIFGSFYLGIHVQASSPNFVNFKIDWNILLSFFTAIGTVAIPFVLYSLGKKEANRKEKRDEEADRRNKLQHYYHQVIYPLVKQLEDINAVRAERGIKILDKIQTYKNDSSYMKILSIEHEEYAHVDYSNMLALIGKIHKQISNIKKEVHVYQASYEKIIQHIEYILDIVMKIDIRQLYGKQFNEGVSLLITIFSGRIAILVGALESSIIYLVYDKEQEQNLLHDLDSNMKELLNSVEKLTRLKFTI